MSLISAREALGLVLSHVTPADPRSGWALDAVGHVLARPVLADRDFPPFDRATMDGYAVLVSHAGRKVAVRGEAKPGAPPSDAPTEAACVEIMTGAPCPPGTEAVVMKEEVTLERRDARVTASMPARVSPGQNIVRRGAERRAGEVLVPEGTVMNALSAALVAAVGGDELYARYPPSLSILVTGDELVQPVAQPGPVQIRDTNGSMLTVMARAAGVSRIVIQYVHDTTQTLARALDVSSDSDVVVLTGGVSAGNYNLVPQALEDHGATTVFHKVAQQPGKPLLFAVKGRRLFFGLPGTPLGCHLGFFRYVMPALRVLAGRSPEHAGDVGVMGEAWSTKSDRQQFVLARVVKEGGAWRVTPLRPRGSSDLFSVFAANAYVAVPEGVRELAPGVEVRFEWLER